MNRFTIIALIIIAFGLIRDFKRDKGLNKKAKIYHSILITLLIALYAGSFGVLGSVIRNFEKIKARFSVDIGIISGEIHIVLYFLHLGISLFVLVFAYQMVSRKEIARKRLLIFLPVLGVLSTFNFYRGWLNIPNEPGELILNDWVILLIGLIIAGGLTILYMKVYSSEWMKKFFQFQHSKNETITDTTEE